MQTPEGIIKFRQTMINKYGSEEAWRAFMQEVGAKGGSKKVPKGFALSGKASSAGKKGGHISRRTRSTDYA